jgi:cyclophilin family peptidyl-prolyl cis-trans isomerase
MANSGVNTNGSQFFICIADDTSKLQPLYNLFGKVASGIDVATAIKQGDVMQSVTVAVQQ